MISTSTYVCYYQNTKNRVPRSDGANSTLISQNFTFGPYDITIGAL